MKSNWYKVKLRDVCVQITDGVHNTVYDNTEGDYFLLSCKNIKNGVVYIGDKERRIDKKTLEKLRSRTKMSIGDVLISSVGTIGETAIVKEDNPPYEFQRSVAIFKPNQHYITPRFLYYSLRHKKKKLQHLAEGAVQQCLFINPLKEFEISIPTLEEQEKIVNVLSSLDNKIELNEKINQNLEAQAQAIFKSWFVDFEPFKNGKFVDSELGKIPEGWVVNTLSNIVSLKKGKKPKNLSETKHKNYMPYLTIDALSGGNPLFCDTGKMLLAKEKDILLVMDGASSGTIFYGLDGVVASTIIKLELAEFEVREIIFAFLNYKQSDLKSHTIGSAIPHLDKDRLLSYKIALPSNEKLLRKISDTLTSLRDNIVRNKKESRRLSQLRDTLLPKLMSGEIDVSDVAV